MAALLSVLLAAAAAGEVPPPHCAVQLFKVVPARGRPGDVVALHGNWGADPRGKFPLLNHRRMNKMVVRSWDEKILRVVVPEEIRTRGFHKIGVFCRDPKTRKASASNWLEFLVEAPAFEKKSSSHQEP